MIKTTLHMTGDGKVTIPPAVREACGLAPPCELEVSVEGSRIALSGVEESAARPSGSEIVSRMIGKATARLDLSTEDILEMTRSESSSAL